MATYLLTWNPQRAPSDDYASLIERIAADGSAVDRWSLGGSKKIRKGDRVFLLRQGIEPRGIVASGVANTDYFEDEHYDPERAAKGDRTTYCMVLFDRFIDVEQNPDDILSVDKLKQYVPGLNTAIQSSGTQIDDDIAVGIEQLWQKQKRPVFECDDACLNDITRQDILDAIELFDKDGYPPTFADSVAYDILYNDVRYPPKAIVGIAARRPRGRMMFSFEFEAGKRRPCNRLLESAGFELVPKLQVDQPDFPDEIIDPEIYWEGATRKVTVNAYERNPVARQKCIDHYGSSCCVCGFDFEKYYGEYGSGYIHVHHLKPLSETNKKYEVDPINDLRPVCPNCHAMLHYGKVPKAIEELKSDVQKNGFGA